MVLQNIKNEIVPGRAFDPLNNMVDIVFHDMKEKLQEAFEEIKRIIPDANRYDSDDFTPPEASEEETEKWLNYIFTHILPNAANEAIGILEDNLG